MALKSEEPVTLTWARQLQALAQTGLTFARDPYDIERYQAANSLAMEMLATVGETATAKIERLFRDEAGYATPKVDVRGAVFRDEAPPPAAGNCSDSAVRCNHSDRLISEETQHGPIHRRLPVRQRPNCGVGTSIPGRPLSLS